MTRYAKSERAALVDALRGAGPDAPTLCTGWTARDLAAHVVVRERDPVAAAGIVVKPLARLTERRQAKVATRDFAELLKQIQEPPVWSTVSNPITDEAYNLVEMFVHTEDVRRARPDWRPRTLEPGLTEALWSRCKSLAGLALRRFPGRVTVEWPGHGTAVGGGGGPEVIVRGEPGELIMFLYGRQAAAHVDLSGPDEEVQRLRHAPLGV